MPNPEKNAFKVTLGSSRMRRTINSVSLQNHQKMATGKRQKIPECGRRLLFVSRLLLSHVNVQGRYILIETTQQTKTKLQ